MWKRSVKGGYDNKCDMICHIFYYNNNVIKIDYIIVSHLHTF